MTALLRLSLIIFCYKLSDCFAVDAQDTFSLNLVLSSADEVECNGSQPTVRVRTRLVSVLPVRKYTQWIPVLHNCSAAHNLTLSLSTIFNGTILNDTVVNPLHYQFRIDLSPADPCHCLTVDSATGVIGNIIFNQWRDGSFWCGNNITQLCASSTTFYSVLISQNGSLFSYSNDALSCDDNLIDDGLNNTKCTAVDVWKDTQKCCVSRASNVNSCSPDANATRVCHCNGEWGQVHCHPSLQLVEELLEASLAEESLMIQSLLLPNTTTITQRLDLLMRAVQEQLNTTQGITETFLQLLLNIVENLPNEVINASSSFSLLSLLDKVALNLRLNRTVNSHDDLIRARVIEVFPSSGRVTGIQVDNNYISLPDQIFEDISEPVFMASYYFKNISNLLPEGAQEPISSVISSTLDCDECKTTNLSENVIIFFDLPPKITSNTKCVFANLQDDTGAEFWNDSGCSTISFENGSVMCSCNHLSHFAILLSTGQSVNRLWIIIWQVLQSISLVFLLATILAFLLQRSLWNMRNYIHCMLCGSMFIAQLLFFVGINRTENEGVCSAIAILQHYLFLVMFMWMLMEGVVLYLKLVKVFTTNHKRYIAFFTIASFGIPLLYMILVVPLGLLANTEHIVGNHYGRRNADGQLAWCWLRYDTNFIWALVAPAVIIIMVNVGFLIMALVVMCRHMKKQDKKSRGDTTKNWLKVIISLVIVMGIAWIGQLIFFTDLREISYIVALFTACQGTIIFILLVPLSKQVRDAYINWWSKTWTHLLQSVVTQSDHLPAQSTPTENEV